MAVRRDGAGDDTLPSRQRCTNPAPFPDALTGERAPLSPGIILTTPCAGGKERRRRLIEVIASGRTGSGQPATRDGVPTVAITP
jgi:hypothetical protein